MQSFLLISVTLFSCSTILAYSFSISSLKGFGVINAADHSKVDFGNIIESCKGKEGIIVVFGTYAADFNMIEYSQRLRHYIPLLKDMGVSKFCMIVNGSPTAANNLAEILDLPSEIELFSDSMGTIGRSFGVSRGWKADDKEMNPYLKLFGMLWGLGAYATLPAVIGGYLGNPWSPQPWIDDALAQGQLKGRWPNNALEIDSNTGKVLKNKFSELPVVGTWKRRPLELATLRLQNMIGVSLSNWDKLKPSEEELKNGILTQLGGCLVLNKSGEVVFEWRDAGICHVANFEDILKKSKKYTP